MISNKIKVLGLLTVLALPACSSTPDEPMMPVDQCRASYWEQQAMQCKQQVETLQKQIDNASEKNKRLEEDYNETFRK